MAPAAGGNKRDAQRQRRQAVGRKRDDQPKPPPAAKPSAQTGLLVFAKKHSNALVALSGFLTIMGGIAAFAAYQHIDYLNAQINSKNGEITNLNNRASKAEENEAKANKELRDAKDTIAQLDFKATQLQAKLESTQKERDDAIQTAASVFTKQEANARYMRELEDENAAVRKQAETSASDAEKLSQKLYSIRTELAEPARRDYQEQIDRISAMLLSLDLQPWTIKIENWDIEAAYIIERTKGPPRPLPYELVSFRLTEYTLASGFQCLRTPELCSDLCGLIDRSVLAYRQERVQEYRSAYERLGPDERQLSQGTERAIVAELVVLERLLNEVADWAHLFLRGTADGQEASWSRALADGYKYQEVTRFVEDRSRCRNDQVDCWVFGDEERLVVTDPYTETHLPDLRAKYVSDNLSSVLAGCAGQAEADVRILQGIDSRYVAGRSRAVLGLVVIGRPI